MDPQSWHPFPGLDETLHNFKREPHDQSSKGEFVCGYTKKRTALAPAPTTATATQLPVLKTESKRPAGAIAHTSDRRRFADTVTHSNWEKRKQWHEMIRLLGPKRALERPAALALNFGLQQRHVIPKETVYQEHGHQIHYIISGTRAPTTVYQEHGHPQLPI
jgi:hypothetical protein